jgi:MFS family permease
MGLLALVAAAILVPETRPHEVRRREALRQRRATTLANGKTESLWTAFPRTLPRPLSGFMVLLFISFAMYFAWAYFEPLLLFYVFDDLGWTTVQFGIAAGGYGLATALSQTTLGQVGDRFGRKPAILVGLCLFCVQVAGPVFTTSFALIMLSFAIAGLGEGLVSPALGAFLVDISEERHRSRVMGIRTSASSLGGVVGPLVAAAVASRSVPPQSAFVGAIAVVLVGAFLALLVLREPGRAAWAAAVEAWPVSDGRVVAAQASLRSIVDLASSVRGRRGIMTHESQDVG